MQKIHTKKFIGTPFILTSEEIPTESSAWTSNKVSIWRDNNLIGEYIRNYPDYAAMTFYPFKLDDVWYALYSAHYTTTRVMRLNTNSIEDWCGEEPNDRGFCPVEYYVPQYNKLSEICNIDSKDITIDTFTVDTDVDISEFLSEQTHEKFVKTQYCDFAFMCGCHWGDDSSWKLRYIDLSNIHNKEFKIENKFGYWELPTTLNLRQCINMSNWEPDHSWIELTRMEHVNLTTDERY